MRKRKPRPGTFYVVQIDDHGQRRITENHDTAVQAAQAARALDERIDKRSFAKSWNSQPSDGVRYEIGVD